MYDYMGCNSSHRSCLLSFPLAKKKAAELQGNHDDSLTLGRMIETFKLNDKIIDLVRK
jgi:hypothetical protein